MLPPSIWSPMREPVYRRIWIASLMSNFGLLIQGVGAAWAMMQLTGNPKIVALVQTAAMVPAMLGSVPAGALADIYDKRKVAISGLSISLLSAASLCSAANAGLLTPWVILLFCVLTGCGSALFSPAWQSSTAEQVSIQILPQAIALNSVSYNIARSFGPAIGGVIVAAAGPTTAFLANSLLYVPLIFVLVRWRRSRVPPRLPPERIVRAVTSGVLYVAHSPVIRWVVLRTFGLGFAGAAIYGLMPLIARVQLAGTALTYGLLLGGFGIGAVLGALMVSRVRAWMSSEAAVRTASIIMGASFFVISYSGVLALTIAALVAAGAMWMLSLALFNIAVQTTAPRWVVGRALATFQAAVTGGIAIGGWLWGSVALSGGISVALYWAGAALVLLPSLGLIFAMPTEAGPKEEALVTLADPEVTLPVTLRSGPIVVEVDYRVDPSRAREYYELMQSIEKIRRRNGAYGWSISRHLADTSMWSERFECPTWLDYLHMRSRSTRAEHDDLVRAGTFGDPPARPIVRRMLERPVGSVRWKEDVPDSGITTVMPLG